MIARAARPALWVACAALAACATAGGTRPAPSALLGAGWTPAPGQPCAEIAEKDSLPGVDRVADSLSLAAALAPRLAEPASYAVFATAWDTLGAPDTAVYVTGTLAADAQDAAAGEVLSRLKAQLPLVRLAPPPEGGDSVATRTGWTLLLRADGGGGVRLRSGWQEECAPVLDGGEQVRVAMRRIFRTVGGAVHSMAPGAVPVRITVDTAGAVTSAEMLDAGWSPQMDTAIVSAVRGFRFIPARINRHPVPVWMVFSVMMGPDARQSLAARPGVGLSREAPYPIYGTMNDDTPHAIIMQGGARRDGPGRAQ